jgi:hypothetical protein
MAEQVQSGSSGKIACDTSQVHYLLKAGGGMECTVEKVLFHGHMKRAVTALLALAFLLEAGGSGSRVLYVGGTVAGVPEKSSGRIELSKNDSLTLNLRDRSIEVEYQSINTLEYGMRVSRRYMEAVLISPIFLAAKRRTHFLTIGYSDAEGRQQAVVLQVGKEEIRPLLVSLEARTGRRVEFQDEEARKAGKG